MKSKGVVKTIEQDSPLPEDAATNVVDFVALLQKSLSSKKRSPAKAMVDDVVEPAGKKTAPKKRALPKAKKKA